VTIASKQLARHSKRKSPSPKEKGEKITVKGKREKEGKKTMPCHL